MVTVCLCMQEKIPGSDHLSGSECPMPLSSGTGKPFTLHPGTHLVSNWRLLSPSHLTISSQLAQFQRTCGGVSISPKFSSRD